MLIVIMDKPSKRQPVTLESLAQTMAAGFSTLDKKIDSKFGILDKKIDSKFGILDKKIDAVDKKIDDTSEQNATGILGADREKWVC